jgi:hypothetical protein
MWLVLCALRAFAADPQRLVEVTVGESVVVETPRTPTAAAAADPSILEVWPFGPPLKVTARRVGTTELTVVGARPSSRRSR